MEGGGLLDSEAVLTGVLTLISPMLVSGQSGSGDLRYGGEKEGASRPDEDLARGLLSLRKPSNVRLPCA